MRQRNLGRAGVFVSELCLGMLTFGGSIGNWGQIGNLQPANVERQAGKALVAGVNFIDTAAVRAGGVSE